MYNICMEKSSEHVERDYICEDTDIYLGFTYEITDRSSSFTFRERRGWRGGGVEGRGGGDLIESR